MQPKRTSNFEPQLLCIGVGLGLRFSNHSKPNQRGEKQEKEGDISRIIVNKVKEKAVKRDGSFACFVIDIKITTTSYSSA
jgi:hypothetical protein